MTTTISPAETAAALALVDAFDAADTSPALPAAMAAVGQTDPDEGRRLLRLGGSLQNARDEGLDELCQLAYALDLAEVRTRRAELYARLAGDEAALAEWIPEVAAGGETTEAALRAVLAHMTQPAR